MQVNVVAHEIAHSWTGNLVSNETWQDFWLNEGIQLARSHLIRTYLLLNVLISKFTVQDLEHGLYSLSWPIHHMLNKV